MTLDRGFVVTKHISHTPKRKHKLAIATKYRTLRLKIHDR